MNPENTDSHPAGDAKPTGVQTFGTTTVRIMKSLIGGARFAEIQPKGRPSYHVPIELLALAAGKDAWMRNIQVRCTECRKLHAADELNGGGYCPTCVEAQDDENMRLDEGGRA